MSTGTDQFCPTPSGLRLCYRTYGSAAGAPLLLIAGLGLQLISWPSGLIDGLVDRGFWVIAFDNRDVGLSGRVAAKPPGLFKQLLRLTKDSPYDLGDMTADTLALLDHLQIDRAHLVGMSMGGMIAQTLAARYPQRVRSLTSIFSTTGARNVGQPAASTLWRLLKPAPRNREAAVARFVNVMRHIGATAYPLPENDLRHYASQAWDRGQGLKDSASVARQIGAIMKSADRTAEVRRIHAPTLVIHGDIDRMVAPSGGKATAQAIPGARLVTLPGMGHSIPDGVVPALLDLITSPP